MGESPLFTVVFVCTGNRARSPIAQALLRRRLPECNLVVGSCGVLDLGPMPALSEAVAVSARIGIDLRGHRATVLRPGELHDVNLILGFEPAHVAAAVIHGRAARERSFTLPELAVLLEAVAIPFPRPGPVELLERAHLSRSSMNSAPSITDPLGGTPGLFMRTVAEIDRYVGTIARALFGASENCAGAVRHP